MACKSLPSFRRSAIMRILDLVLRLPAKAVQQAWLFSVSFLIPEGVAKRSSWRSLADGAMEMMRHSYQGMLSEVHQELHALS